MSGSSNGSDSASAGDTITFNPNAAYFPTGVGTGEFALSGTVSSPAGVKSVDISAQVGPLTVDLGNAAVNANGTWTFDYLANPHGQSFFTATETDNAGGTASVSPPISVRGFGERVSKTAQGTYKEVQSVYKAVENFYTPDGSYAASAYEMYDGARTVLTRDDGQTLTSQFHDTFANGGVPDTTFVFDPGYVHDVVKGLRLQGAGQDMVSLPSSDFANFAQVLQDTQNTAHGAVIHDTTSGDTLLIAGVTKQELSHAGGDFSFHA